MSQMLPTESPRDLTDLAPHHSRQSHRLQTERRFRAEQVVALDNELSARGRHECVTLALRIAAASALAEIDAALARMAEGRYGFCVMCAQPIPDERLDVLPMAPLCMPCHYNQQNCHRKDMRGERDY